jgi:hypothetical protein
MKINTDLSPRALRIETKPLYGSGKRKCKILNCKGSVIAFDLCQSHYLRLRKNIPMDTRIKKGPIETRFNDSFEKHESGCWLWIGFLNENGYGLIKNNYKTLQAHRVSFALKRGPIPKGICVLHKCDTPRCVNPDHLYLGSKQKNNEDMQIRNRQVRGEKDGMAKLTKADVVSIRKHRYSGETLSFIANLFGVGISQIHRITTNQSWSHVI